MNNFYLLILLIFLSFFSCSNINCKFWPKLKAKRSLITININKNNYFNNLKFLFKPKSEFLILHFFLNFLLYQQYTYDDDSLFKKHVQKVNKIVNHHNLLKRETQFGLLAKIKLALNFLTKKNKSFKSLISSNNSNNVLSPIILNSTQNNFFSLFSNKASPIFSTFTLDTTNEKFLSKSKNNLQLKNDKCFYKIKLDLQPVFITSPGWGHNLTYSSNLDCVWEIKISCFLKKPKIKIKIIYLEIEEESNCSYDYLEIKNYKKFCGFISDKEFFINDQRLVLIFKSDFNYEKKGFNLKLFIENEKCVSEIKALDFGTITSPEFPKNYPNSFECWTWLNAAHFRQKSQNISITLAFDFIDLEQDDDCNYDFVEIFKAKEKNINSSELLGKFCGSFFYETWNQNISNPISAYKHFNTLDSSLSKEKNKYQVESLGQYLLIHFKSDQFLNAKGFRAHYKVHFVNQADSMICDNMLQKSLHIFKTPNYPKHYPPNLNCSIIIKAPNKDQQIILTFDSFMMEISPNCSFDRLEIFEQDQDVQVLCGRKTSKWTFYSKFSNIKLKVYSDSFAEYSGFLARYKFVKGLPINSINSNEIKFEFVPKNDSILKGSSYLLNCKIKFNSSNYTTFWFKDDRLVTHKIWANNTLLLLPEFTESSVGRYTCKHGPYVFEAWLSLKFFFYCNITFHTRLRDLTIFEFEDVVLECEAESTNILNNTVTITWAKDGKQINNYKRFQQLKNGFLVIKAVQKDDSGFYHCVAQVENMPDCVSQSIARLDVKNKNISEVICGVPNFGHSNSILPKADFHGKIIGGNIAEKGAFPWQVMLWTMNRKSFCGGALLNERWVVTAAHCLTQSYFNPNPPPIKSIIVKLGKYDQQTNEEHEINVKVKDVIEHPNYNPNTYDNDIALMRLNDSIKFNSFIKPICLGASKRTIDEIFFNEKEDRIQMGYVSGWGQLKEKGPQPRYLQEIKIPIVKKEICKISTTFRVTSNMFCAGYNQEVIGDTCKGDSGGPFVGQYKGKWYLLGIVSWGEGCGELGKYGFYTKVNNYFKWIQELIKY